MSSTVIIRQFVAVSKEARKKVIDALAHVAQSSQHTAGILKHAVTIPRDQHDEKSIFVIEEYASQAAYDSHIASRSSEDLLALLAKTTLLASPPDSLSFHVTSSYSRQETTKAKDPYILIASFEYKEDSREAALAGWQNVTSACQHSEEGTFAYVVGKDTKNALRVGSVAVYESEKYFWAVHAKGNAVVDNKTKYGEIRTKTDLAYYKIVAGFLHKEPTRKVYSKL
ncbi:hypothetical protein EKO04_007230 [Ascochyta lentis]|uniref:ABM domain-containing protein n=1 Tax=Ascochyta lentis TaxID=205686 RepID=A0A8H7MIE4_9PLEO|nr:hypothetical protein EKO04_007230 [Ascochyta lentis]